MGCEPAHDNGAESTTFQPVERWLCFTFLAAIVALRVLFCYCGPLDSDEPQHLHVVWGWVNGRLPYRDLFDNHMPLFHVLWAPIFRWIGECPDALFPMRLTMLPLHAVIMAGVYAIGRSLFSRQVGCWAMLMVGAEKGFFLCSSQFRPDSLWTALWIVALLLLARGQLTWTRSFAVGALLGTALGVSIKTTLMLAAIGGAGVATIILCPEIRARHSRREALRCASAAVVGLLLVPSAIIIYFALQGALAPFVFCNLEHNVSLVRPARLLAVPATLPIQWCIARALWRAAPDAELGSRRLLVFLSACFYALALYSFSPARDQQNCLPSLTVLPVFLTPLVLWLPGSIARLVCKMWQVRAWPNYIPAALYTVTSLVLVVLALAKDKTDGQTHARLLAHVLTLTGADEPVMDLKGETVFRRRPYYFALEQITRRRIKEGRIPDSIPEYLISTGTCVVVTGGRRYPIRAQSFINSNYLSIGPLSVAGRVLAPLAVTESASLAFEVEIPARYAIITETGPASGWLDGTDYDGPRSLAAGPHEFRPAPGHGRLAFVWAPAVELGYSPVVFRGELARPHSEPPHRIDVADASIAHRGGDAKPSFVR